MIITLKVVLLIPRLCGRPELRLLHHQPVHPAAAFLQVRQLLLLIIIIIIIIIIIRIMLKLVYARVNPTPGLTLILRLFSLCRVTTTRKIVSTIYMYYIYIDRKITIYIYIHLSAEIGLTRRLSLRLHLQSHHDGLTRSFRRSWVEGALCA